MSVDVKDEITKLRGEISKLKHEISQKQRRENRLVAENTRLKEKLQGEEAYRHRLAEVGFVIWQALRGKV